MSQAQTYNYANVRISAPVGEVSRLDRWIGVDDSAKPRFIPLTEDKIRQMKPEDILKLTMNNLALMGQSEIDLIINLLPENHQLRRPRQFKPMTLKNLPYLGSCKVGEVIVGKQKDAYLVNQIYMSNFEADIDTSGKGDLFKGISREVSNKPRMFYGLNVLVDRMGQAIGFDRTSGKDGLAFQTRDKAEAVWQIAAASTHQPVEVLRAHHAARR